MLTGAVAAPPTQPAPNTLRPEAIATIAAGYADGGCVCGCIGRQIADVERYRWAYAPAFPIDTLPGSAADWQRWYAQERAHRLEHALDVLGFEAWWRGDVAARESEPLIVITDDAGQPHLWDGAHRVGLDHSDGRTSAPAFVGTLISSLTGVHPMRLTSTAPLSAALLVARVPPDVPSSAASPDGIVVHVAAFCPSSAQTTTAGFDLFDQDGHAEIRAQQPRAHLHRFGVHHHVFRFAALVSSHTLACDEIDALWTRIKQTAQTLLPESLIDCRGTRARVNAPRGLPAGSRARAHGPTLPVAYASTPTLRHPDPPTDDNPRVQRPRRVAPSRHP